jgi:hypothetical protein
VCPGKDTRKGVRHSYVNAGVDYRNMFEHGYQPREIHICTNCGTEKNKRPPTPAQEAQHKFAEEYPGPGQMSAASLPAPQPMSYQLRYRPGLP